MRIPAVAPSIVALLDAAAPAQEARSRYTVTPQGVFPVRELAHGTFTPLVNPNPSPRALRWTYPNAPGTPWISECVSAGANGATDSNNPEAPQVAALAQYVKEVQL